MHPSIWQATAQKLDLPALRSDMTVDTVIVGGGMTGLTTAMKLSGAGSSKNIYIATGFAADGLTWGALAGTVIADEILGKPDESAAQYRPTRIDPGKSAKKFVSESANVAKEYAVGYLGSTPELNEAGDIAIGDGRVVKIDGERVAVRRDAQNTLRAVSAVCTHMRCIVGWNGAEQTWDCRCHGSRFSADGVVIEGPALEALKGVALPPAPS